MLADTAKGNSGLRGVALTVLFAAMLFSSGSAPAYSPIDQGNGIVSWNSSSTPSIWDNSSRTLSWTFYTANFPQAGWPNVVDAGGAFQNAVQSFTDVTGKALNFRRLPDTNLPPALNDGVLTYSFILDEVNASYLGDISGANGVTYVESQAGVMMDADMFINADPGGGLAWTTDGTPGTRDVQATTTHETMHVSGAGHTPYFNARVFPFARSPVIFLQDHCLASDDRNYLRDIYKAAPFNGTLSGSVVAAGALGVDRAMVVATDANDVPQAITPTRTDGSFSGLSVPPGSYKLTVFHGINSAYSPTGLNDVDFVGATNFVTATTTAAVTVTAGNNTNAPPITVTDGTPGLTMSVQSISPTAPQFQSLFVSSDQSDPSHVGTLILEIDTTGGNILPGDISSVSLGNGITVTGAVTTVNVGPSTTDLMVPYSVTAGAAPGARNLIVNLSVNNNERLFLPGVIKVVGQGGLSIAASTGNPGDATLQAGAQEVPLLGLSLQSNGNNPEDVRIRRLAFNIAGTGPALPALRLWIDKGTVGSVSGADDRIFSGAAYAAITISETTQITGTGSPPGSVIFDNLALTIPANATVRLLLTADMPASGSGIYTASFDPAGLDSTGEPNIVSHGMWWGDNVTPAGTTVTGGAASTEALAISSPEQVRTTGGAAIPVGGSTPETQVTLKAVVTTILAGNVGMEVEVRPLGTTFTGMTHSVPANPGVASGSTISITVTGLMDPQSYHWRARPLHITAPPGPWVSFSTNFESEIDFSCDSSTTNPPVLASLQQFEKDGTTQVLLGGLVKGRVILSGTNGTNNSPVDSSVRLEIEVRPSGTPFTGVPNVFSSFVPSGTVATASFSGPTNTYHWQARTANTYGTSSAWVNFNAAAIHFDFKRASGSGGGGCGATIPAGSGGLWWGLAALGLIAIFSRGRSL